MYQDNTLSKRLAAFVATVAVALWVHAQGIPASDAPWLGALNVPASGGGDCATSDTTLPHDTLLEGFGTPGYENAWTEVGTTANIDDAADSSALTDGKPDGACDTAFYLDVPTDGTETFSRYNHGSTIDLSGTELDFYMYLWVATRPDAGESFQIVKVSQYTGGSAIGSIFLSYSNESGGQLRLQGYGSGLSDVVVISEDTWVKVKMHLDTTAADSYIQVDDGDNKTFTRGNESPQYFFIGAVSSLEANDNAQLYFDLICVNTP